MSYTPTPRRRQGRKSGPLAFEALDDRCVPSTTVPRTIVYVESNNPEAGQNAILAYRSDPTTGELSPFGTFLTGGTGTPNPTEILGPDDSDQNVIVDADRRFLFAVNSGSDTIAVFNIRSDGTLGLVPGAPFASGGIEPVSLGLAGSNLYVVNKGDQAVGQASGGSRPNYTGFRVGSDGRLSPIAQSTIEVNPGSSPSQALITPDGQFLFGSDLFAFPLVPAPPLPPFIPPFASLLEGFRIQPDGRLAQAAGTPRPTLADTPLPPFVLGLQAHPTERILYVGFVAGNQVGVYTYDAAGALTFVETVPSTGQGTCWIAISPDARFLFTANSTSDSVSVISLADPLHPVEVQNLDLAGPKAVLPVPPGSSPVIFDTTPFQLATDPTGQFLYVVNHETAGGLNPAGNALHVLAVGTDGRLTESASPLLLPVPATADPQGVVALRFDPKRFLAAGAGPGGAPSVKVYDAAGSPVRSFLAYDANFVGGVSVATGDVTGDGVDDIVTGAGAGGGPHVKVFDGSSGAELFSFFAYDAGFAGGVNVGLADVDGDGRADIITGAGPGGSPHVKVFGGTDLRLVNSFFAYSSDFTGGVLVAGGDLGVDGRAEIVTGAGVGGGPHVRAFDGQTGSERVSFFADDPNLRGGVTVGVGAFDGDAAADIVTGPGGSPTVRVFDGAATLGGTVRPLANLAAYPASPFDGAFVAATDLNGDGRADIITGAGAAGGPHVKVFDAATLAEIESFFAFDPSFNGGVHVG